MLDQQNLTGTGAGRGIDGGPARPPTRGQRRVNAMDVVVEWQGDLETLADKMRSATAIGSFRLSMISDRDTMSGPGTSAEGNTMPRWRCRFAIAEDAKDGERDVPWLLSVIGEHMRWLYVEKVDQETGAVGSAGPSRARATQ